MAAVLFLSFASGLPFNLTNFSLQAWLADSGLAIKTIGFLSLVALPYNLKFLWAPFLDRYFAKSYAVSTPRTPPTVTAHARVLDVMGKDGEDQYVYTHSNKYGFLRRASTSSDASRRAGCARSRKIQDGCRANRAERADSIPADPAALLQPRPLPPARCRPTKPRRRWRCR